MTPKEKSKDDVDIDSAETIRLALIKALLHGWKQVEFESSHKLIMTKVSVKLSNHATTKPLLHDINNIGDLFQICSFKIVTRNGREICMKVASFVKKLRKDVEWENFFPV
ncbi:hypothetical protein ACH5RR_029528 [Cinchona calisaya]|uniref:RNase H type-1 domain-containing protein n=1 Tax=Cinchona calisaya TaxID=153742 RepID=A0ABD2YV77_9GENT